MPEGEGVLRTISGLLLFTGKFIDGKLREGKFNRKNICKYEG